MMAQKNYQMWIYHLRIVCDKYMYTTRLGQKMDGDIIRITSIGEFNGWNTNPTLYVDKAFKKEAIRQFPQLQSLIEKTTTKCGHRPLVNDGILLLGRLNETSNVYVTCGPGSNGWKLAMGSGEVIARLIDGQSPDDIENDIGVNVKAFAPSGRIVHSPLFARLCRARWNV